MNYFSIFGLPTCYQIDIKKLTSIFQDLQRQNHPDKFVKNSQENKISALKKSTIINQAWQTLRDPIARAEHLLYLNGFKIKENQYTIHDKNFLLEQLELNEELDIIEKEKDEIKLEIFVKKSKKMFNIIYTKMVEQLNNKDWINASDSICKLFFLKKLLDRIEQFEEKLFNF